MRTCFPSCSLGWGRDECPSCRSPCIPRRPEDSGFPQVGICRVCLWRGGGHLCKDSGPSLQQAQMLTPPCPPALGAASAPCLCVFQLPYRQREDSLCPRSRMRRWQTSCYLGAPAASAGSPGSLWRPSRSAWRRSRPGAPPPRRRAATGCPRRRLPGPSWTCRPPKSCQISTATHPESSSGSPWRTWTPSIALKR